MALMSQESALKYKKLKTSLANRCYIRGAQNFRCRCLALDDMRTLTTRGLPQHRLLFDVGHAGWSAELRHAAQTGIGDNRLTVSAFEALGRVSRRD
jgi:hypothetical protein